MLRQHVTDPITNARIGIAGPIWGIGATLVAWPVYVATDAGIWAAIAAISAFLNLFNLTPIWQFDGSRGLDPTFAALVLALAWFARTLR
jgi:Zn-dependent protease